MQKIEIFGRNIKYLRLKKNKGQQEVADYLDVGYNTLGDYERNKTEPSFSSLLKLSELYQVSIDNLLKTDIEKVQVLESLGYDQNHQKSTDKNTGTHTGNGENSMKFEEPTPVYLVKTKDDIIADQRHLIDAQKTLIDSLNQHLTRMKGK